MTRMQTLLAATLALITSHGYADTTDRALERKADAIEEGADTVRDIGEDRADAVEEADPGMDSDATEEAADAAREHSEDQADAMEDEADAVRDAK